MKYSNKDRQINNDFYSYFIRHHQDDGWGDKDKYGNFELLCKIVDFTNSSLMNASVLDVGSGTGDFSEYLRKQGIKEYVGIDIFPMSVDLAKMKYNETFICSDFLDYKFQRRFDYVFSSGAIAAILDTDNYQILTAFVSKMWRLAEKGVAFNFLTREYTKENDDELFLYDFDEVLRICRNIVKSAPIKYVQNRAGDNNEFLQTHIYLLKKQR
ncbi:MAG: hypothetical protein KatS3mg089_0763 [Patescibacteria group bacterium]|nr:MAG: hypothetical protein KatS3mg089_0763 [Patescibacteria group bacterium]